MLHALSAQWLQPSTKQQQVKKPKATKANQKTQFTKNRNPKAKKARLKNNKLTKKRTTFENHMFRYSYDPKFRHSPPATVLGLPRFPGHDSFESRDMD